MSVIVSDDVCDCVCVCDCVWYVSVWVGVLCVGDGDGSVGTTHTRTYISLHPAHLAPHTHATTTTVDVWCVRLSNAECEIDVSQLW